MNRFRARHDPPGIPSAEADGPAAGDHKPQKN
jgi:hypothetical protein